jgi:ubiquinone biosynthesis UbiH/UbiF/VisC/COQ6 family hydroxylase
MSAQAAPQGDVVIVGAGPVGLALACALADAGLGVTLVERQPRAALAAPAPDGREIALTHRSEAILRNLGLWQRLAGDDVAPIREARVLDAGTPEQLRFQPDGAAAREPLGHLVPNAAIRAAAFAGVADRPAITLLDAVRVSRIRPGAEAAQAAAVELADGRVLRARLVVAADSRLSDARRQMGLGAELREFGRDVIVCNMAHAAPSDGIAWECFGYERTLAVLPLNRQRVSTVVTMPGAQSGELMRLPPQEYADLVARQFGDRLGRMRLDGDRHVYPLVAVYARRFVAPRFALAGDAAVGMHPVTAHGFNLGLYGIDALARATGAAHRAQRDVGALDVLLRYEAEHRRATRPLYLGTNALVGLFTDTRGPARLARAAVLRLAEHLPPLKSAITRRLTAGAAF